MENDVPKEVTISVKMKDGSAHSFQLTDAQRKAVIRALGLSVIGNELAGLDDWSIEQMLAE